MSNVSSLDNLIIPNNWYVNLQDCPVPLKTWGRFDQVVWIQVPKDASEDLRKILQRDYRIDGRMVFVNPSRVTGVRPYPGGPLLGPQSVQPVFPKGDPDFVYSESRGVYDIALRYLKAGVSVVPIGRAIYGAKTLKSPPMHSWEPFRDRIMTPAERLEYFHDRHYGLAAICGEISGNLEEIDFDDADSWSKWSASVKAQRPDLFGRLVIAQTPRPGFQVWYRCRIIERNQPLARVRTPVLDAVGKPILNRFSSPTYETKPLVETRGTGGLFLVPGCPPDCHPTGRSYLLLQGSPETIPVITVEERSFLFSEARRLDKAGGVSRRKSTGDRHDDLDDGEDTPWGDFNARATWEDVLEPHGWSLFSGDWESGQVERPGKPDPGPSATLGVGGLPIMHVFTSSSKFDVDGNYNKFSAYAVLNHGGDRRAAAADLRAQGYGSGRGFESDGQRHLKSSPLFDPKDGDWSI